MYIIKTPGSGVFKLRISRLILSGSLNCPRLGEGWDPANMFNPGKIVYMYVPVPSLSFNGCRLLMCYIFFSFILYMNKAVSFLVWIVLHLPFQGLFKLTLRNGLCSLLKTVWWPIVLNFCQGHLGSWGELSYWQLDHRVTT